MENLNNYLQRFKVEESPPKKVNEDFWKRRNLLERVHEVLGISSAKEKRGLWFQTFRYPYHWLVQALNVAEPYTDKSKRKKVFWDEISSFKKKDGD
jgi:hypothetical protein